MKYKIKKQYTVEVKITEVVELLKKAGVLPADMKPEHDAHAGTSVTARVMGPDKTSCLFISWQETEEIGKDGKEKKDAAVDAAARLRAKRKGR